ncbi:MAG: hypothetical protein ON057_000226 [Glomeribacter sp. 1016415]|nr:hypothetical protein [Glomeribacter sp. 1016415]
MPISQAHLAELAKVSLDEYLRNIPVDNIGTERPFLKKLLSKRKAFMGAKQNIVAFCVYAMEMTFIALMKMLMTMRVRQLKCC